VLVCERLLFAANLPADVQMFILPLKRDPIGLVLKTPASDFESAALLSFVHFVAAVSCN